MENVKNSWTCKFLSMVFQKCFKMNSFSILQTTHAQVPKKKKQREVTKNKKDCLNVKKFPINVRMQNRQKKCVLLVTMIQRCVRDA